MSTRALLDLIARQHGAVAIRQGPEVGVSERTLREIARREGWHDPFPQLGVRIHPASADTFERRVSAALLAKGDRALASRATAAYLQGLIDRPPAAVELVVPHDRNPRPPDGSVKVWRSRTILERDVVRPKGLAATALDRTICDLAAVSSSSQLRGLLIDGRQRKLFDLEGIMRRQALMPGTTGLPMLRALCYQLDASRCDSVLAWLTRRLLRKAGMSPDRSEHPVEAPNGVTVHLDVPFVRYQVAVEAEGLGAHSERWQLERDTRRRNTLGLIPWHIIWVTWQRLDEDPEGFTREVRRALQARGWPGGPRS